MRYIFIMFMLLMSLNASSSKFIDKMGYEINYEQALLKAKKENKILMMVASTKSCPWCRKLERQTLQKKSVNNKIKENFIALAVDKDESFYPKVFEVKVVPTIYFINPKDESVVLKTLGYKNRKDFKEILEQVALK